MSEILESRPFTSSSQGSISITWQLCTSRGIIKHVWKQCHIGISKNNLLAVFYLLCTAHIHKPPPSLVCAFTSPPPGPPLSASTTPFAPSNINAMKSNQRGAHGALLGNNRLHLLYPPPLSLPHTPL